MLRIYITPSPVMFMQHYLLLCSCYIHKFFIFLLNIYSIPGRYESFWKEVDYVKYLLKNRQEMKLENAGIGVLFGLECLARFYGGEIVGRGFTLTGYHV